MSQRGSPQAKTMLKIFRNTATEQWKRQDRAFARNQLKKIYSEQLAKLMEDRKFELMCQQNQQSIDQRIDNQISLKKSKISLMLEKSAERREKLLKDRVDLYESQDKRWFDKKESIRIKTVQQDKSMLKTAKQYQQKDEKFWKMKELKDKKQLKEFSQKHHFLYNSNVNIRRSQHDDFNSTKLHLLLRKRQRLTAQAKPSRNLTQDIIAHRQKESSLSNSREQNKIGKLVTKFNQMEKAVIKKEKKKEEESLIRSRMKINSRTYASNKPEIGEACLRHETRQQRFRTKTEGYGTLTPSRLSAHSPIQRSNTNRQDLYRVERKAIEHDQRSRWLKIEKNLKSNVRAQLAGQLKKSLKVQ